jgi:hypothetical protein
MYKRGDAVAARMDFGKETAGIASKARDGAFGIFAHFDSDGVFEIEVI